MTIEAYIIKYLSECESLAGVPVSGDIPHDIPSKFITVEKTGSGRADHIDAATIAVQSWAATRAEAAALNETVKAAMDAAISKQEISRSELNSDYNYPDLSRNHPRYQAVYEIIYFL